MKGEMKTNDPVGKSQILKSRQKWYLEGLEISRHEWGRGWGEEL